MQDGAVEQGLAPNEKEAWRRRVMAVDASLRSLRATPESTEAKPESPRPKGTPKGRGILALLRARDPGKASSPPSAG